MSVLCEKCGVSMTRNQTGICSRCSKKNHVQLYNCIICGGRTKFEEGICSRHTDRERASYIEKKTRPNQSKLKQVNHLLRQLQRIKEEGTKENPFDFEETKAKDEIDKLFASLSITRDDDSSVAAYEFESGSEISTD